MEPIHSLAHKKLPEIRSGRKIVVFGSICAAIAALAVVVMVRFLPLVMDTFVVEEELTREEQAQLVLEYEYALAQDAIKEQMASPGAVVFCPIEEVLILKDTEPMMDRWSGWADSQNRYGATVRSQWTVLKMLDSSYDVQRGEVDSSASFIVEKIESR